MKSYTKALKQYNKRHKRKGSVVKFSPEYYDVLKIQREFKPVERESELNSNQYFQVDYVMSKLKSSSSNEIITFSEFQQFIDRLMNFEYNLDYSKMLSKEQLKVILENSRKQHFEEMKKAHEMYDDDRDVLDDYDIVFQDSRYYMIAYDIDIFYDEYCDMFFKDVYNEQEWRIPDNQKKEFKRKRRNIKVHWILRDVIRGTHNLKEYDLEDFFTHYNKPSEDTYYMTVNIIDKAYIQIRKTEQMNSRLNLIKHRRHIRKHVLKKVY